MTNASRVGQVTKFLRPAAVATSPVRRPSFASAQCAEPNCPVFAGNRTTSSIVWYLGIGAAVRVHFALPSGLSFVTYAVNGRLYQGFVESARLVFLDRAPTITSALRAPLR